MVEAASGDDGRTDGVTEAEDLVVQVACALLVSHAVDSKAEHEQTDENAGRSFVN